MIHEYDPIIYPRKVWITYDATLEELNQEFPNGYIGGDKFVEEKSSFGSTYKTGDKENNGGVLIRFEGKEAMTSWNMAHEAVHAAACICDYIGIAADWDNDEAYAYLVSFIVKCCEETKSK